MAVPIYVPKLGFTMTEAKLVEWKIAQGDWVEKGNVVLIIETEKISYEIVAEASGFLHILSEPGSVIPVGEVVALLVETIEELMNLRKEHPPSMKSVEAADVIESIPIKPSKDIMEKDERAKISPVARKMAEMHSIDISQIKGSGPGGRIVREDVERSMMTGKTQIGPSAGYEGKKVKAAFALKGMRWAIAEHMQRSLATSAQVTTMGEINMAEMIKFRKSLLKREEKSFAIRISYTDLFVFVLARAIKENPIINSSIIDNEIKIWEDINIGIAVALDVGEYESGLIVPVIKNADKKSLLEISKVGKELVEKARNMKLVPDDVKDGTFTLTNVGGFGLGWSLSTPIINQPQTAILRTATIVERPIVKDGEIVISPIMTYSLTYDHRIVDGAPAGKFLLKFKELMENPALNLI